MDVIIGDDSRREEKGGYAMRAGASGTTTFRYLMVFPAFLITVPTCSYVAVVVSTLTV